MPGDPPTAMPRDMPPVTLKPAQLDAMVEDARARLPILRAEAEDVASQIAHCEALVSAADRAADENPGVKTR